MSTINDELDAEIISIVNRNHDVQEYKRNVRDIAEYIVTRFDTKFGIKDAEEIAEYLVNTHKFKAEDILSSHKDGEIYNMIKYFLFKPKSVVKKKELVNQDVSSTYKSENVIDVLLKTIRRNVDPKTAAKFAAYTLSAALIFGFTVNASNEIKKNEEVSQSLGMMASSSGSYDYEHKINIVSQNDYVVDRLSNGDAVIAYHNDRIAMDIITVCTKNIELFDICMHDVYFNMDYNRLENMDKVLSYLKAYLKDEESLQPIYNKISDCSVFLDYLMKRGIVPSDSPEYSMLLEDIKAYKKAKSNDGVAYTDLSKDSQRRIDALINSYKGLKEDFYNKYIIIKNSLNNEYQLFELEEDDPNFGGRA